MYIIVCQVNFKSIGESISIATDYGHMMAEVNIRDFNINTFNVKLSFCRGWLMENMDKELTVLKWVPINRPKIPQNLFAQAQLFGILMKKRLHWASVIRVYQPKLAKTNNHREIFSNKNTFLTFPACF